MAHIKKTFRCLEQSYAGDYVGLGIVLSAYFLIIVTARPFNRMFALDDLSIQYPHAVTERVPVSGLPLALIIISFTINRPGWHKAHVTILGFFISIVLTSFLTDLVKNIVGRPRPDLIDRCKPKPDLPEHTLFSAEVCLETDRHLLDEGWRSFPSGHSSFSFSGLGYLALFFAGQLHVFRPGADLCRILIALAPIIGALMIAVSRLQDYRHDVYDVTTGSLLGFSIAYSIYRRYYPSLKSTNCNIPFSSNFESRHNSTEDHDEEAGLDRRGQGYEMVPLQTQN